MDATYYRHVRRARQVWEDGFAHVCSKINEVLEHLNVPYRVECKGTLAGMTLQLARRRMANVLLGLRPYLVDMPDDSEFTFWTMGLINGENNLRLDADMFLDDDNFQRCLRALLEAKKWSDAEWRHNIVDCVNVHAMLWRGFFRGIEAKQDESTVRLFDDVTRKDGPQMPDSVDVLDLCKLLAKNRHKIQSSEKSEASVAREFTKETKGKDKKAKNLLRGARRYPHLWK